MTKALNQKMKTKTAKPKTNRRATKDTEAGEVIEMVQRMLDIKRVLVPIDFSKQSEKAVRYAAAFARQFDAKITLLHAYQLPAYPPDLIYVPMGGRLDSAEKALRQRLVLTAQKSVPSEFFDQTLFRIGTPHDEICRAAQELDSDLIIISTHGFTGLKHVLMGSTAERVVRHAPCPVLVVREREHEFA